MSLAQLEHRPLPARIQVLPAPDARGVVRGADDRAWTLKDRAALLRALSGREVVIDANHSTVHAAPNGGESPAMGWAHSFEFGSDGALHAAVNWTPYGAALMQQAAYRYVSPAVNYAGPASAGVLGDITNLHSIGLVQPPNFDSMPALNAVHTPRLTAAQQKICDGLRITPGQFLASPGERRSTLASNSAQGSQALGDNQRWLGDHYAGQAIEQAAASQLTESQARVCRGLHVRPSAYLAAQGERRR